MRVQIGLSLMMLAVLPACVPMSTYRALQAQNAVLEQKAGQTAGLAQDNAALNDRTISLAQQNLHLQRQRSDLLQEAQERDDFYNSVMNDLAAGRLKISHTNGLLTFNLGDDILFDSAKAGLKTAGKTILLEIARAISKSDKTVRVVGHTDDQAMTAGGAYPSNWELSTARATSVVRFLQEEGKMDPSRLLAAGRGQWRPEASNATAAGRQLNRRIEIMLIDKDLLDGPEE